MLSEISKLQKDKYCVLSRIRGTQTESRKGWGWGVRVSIWEDENVLQMNGGDGHTTCEHP